MGLLDSLMKADGSEFANYLNGDATVVAKATRVVYREADEKLGDQFRIDFQVLHSTRPDVGVGEVKTVNENFKMKAEGLVRTRRALAALKTSKTGKACGQGDFGLVIASGEKSDDFAKRCIEESKRLTGPTQPLVDAIVRISTQGRTNRTTGKPYTLFEVSVPSELDLKNAGLI